MDKYGLITNSAAYALMHRDAVGKRVSHAYLIVSPDRGVGEALTDVFLSECIYGDGRKKAAAADIVRLPKGDKVLVEDVEYLLETAYYSPVELPRKFYVIDKCETMNEAAQNKLLKVLEEPPATVTIILRATTANGILPTVLSRSKRVDVRPFGYDEVVEYLQTAYPVGENIYLAAALSDGYIGKAETVMTESVWTQIYDVALDTLKNMKNSRMVLRFSARIAELKRLTDFIDVLELLLADCMLASTGVRDRLRFKNAVKEIIDISAEYDADVVVRVMPTLKRARMRLGLNGNEQSVLDELLFAILEVKAKCRKL